jgi:flagellar biosynthetic protein FliR
MALFALMFVRISTCVSMFPIFGNKNIPVHAKVLLSLLVSFVLFPVMKSRFAFIAGWEDSLILLVAREALCGLFMAFVARFIFIGVEIAGQILSFTMGFSAAQLINPTFGDSGTMMEQFEMILATLLFLGINGHHFLFEAIYRSFEIAPLGRLFIDVKGLASVTVLTQQVFIIGIKLAGPMIAVILFLNIALGMVGRAVPQINVFVISFPVNILVGLFVFSVSIPLLLTVLEGDFMNMTAQMFQFLRAF